MPAEEIVEKAIAENAVVIFSKSWCPYCKKAKALLKSEFPDVLPKIYELDEMDEGQAIQDYLKEKTGQRTVPNIFINGKHTGGSDKLISLNRAGQLAGLVAAAASSRL